MHLMAGRYGHGIAIAVLLLIPLVFFWEMIVEGQEPLAPDTQAARPLREWARQAHDELGEMPLWCPAIFSGMPSYGSFVYTPSGPLDVVRDVRLAFGRTRGLQYFISLIIGALALYGLLVLRRKAPLAALTGTLVYTMTPYFLGLIAAGHATKLHALYLAPLVFLAIELILERRTLAAAAALAAAIALQFWSNHPQISYYTLFLGALYVLGVLIFDRPERWRGRGLAIGLLLGVLALVLVVGLVMEPYAAVLEYTPHSIRGGTGALQADAGAGSGAGWDYATAWSFSPKELICFLFPAWFGLEGSTYWGDLPFTQSTHYLGITVFLLALLGMILWRGRRRWIWFALCGVILLIGFGRYLPLLYRPMYELLPMFDRFRVPSMIYALLPLPAAVLTAEGLQRLGDAEMWASPKPRKGSKRAAVQHPPPGVAGWIARRWPAVCIVLVALLLLWLVAGSAVTDGMRRAGGFVSPREVSQIAGVSQGAQMLAALREMPMDQLRAGAAASSGLVTVVADRMALLRSSVTVGLVLLTLCALAIEVRRRGWIGGELLLGFLFVFVAADLWIIDRKFYDPRPLRQATAVLVPDEAVRFLQGQEGFFRVAPLSAADFGSNRLAAFGIETVGGYQPAKLRAYDDLLRSGAISSLPVLSMLNVRYLLSGQELGGGFPLVSTARGQAGEPVYIHENPMALPRAWFVTHWQMEASAEAVLREVQLPEFDPAKTALVTSDAASGFPAELSAGEVDRIVREGQSLLITARVGGPGPGLLVVSEIYYLPGWQTTIDGEPAQIVPINHVLRGLLVPPGEHQIEMRAVARAYRRGRVANRIAGLAVIVLLGGGVVGHRLRRNRAASATTS